MGKLLSLATAVLSTFAAYNAAAAAPQRSTRKVCWVEFASGQAPGAVGAAGAQLKLWRSTASGIVIRRDKGDVLIDAGFSQNAEAQMAELAPQKQAIARRILASYTLRRSPPEALAAAGIATDRITTIIPTHAHYDHLAGAEDIPGAHILMAPEEIAYLSREQQNQDIVAASNIAAVRARIEPIAFASKPYLGFPRSADVFRDGSVIVVPLPGHTPGSVGIFFSVARRKVLAIGDVAWIMEAVDRGLPKSAALRAFADDNPDATDAQLKAVAAFHNQHPEVAVLPAHDRSSWEAVFGRPGCE